MLQAKPAFVCNQCADESNIDPDSLAPRVIPEDIAFLMNSALIDVVQHGTARGAKVLNRRDIAGKTGTTNDQVDTWFAGYNPDLVVTTWVGFDAPHPLYEYAAALALPVWVDFMKVALKGVPEREVRQPDNVVAVRINPKTGLLAQTNQDNAILEYFRAEEVPSPDEEAVAAQSTQDDGSQEDLF